MRLDRWILRAGLTAAVVSGCSVFTSLDGLSGGDQPLDTHDASPHPVVGKDGATLDGASSPPGSDGAIIDDSGAIDVAQGDTQPAPFDAGDAATPFCSSLSPAAFFCDDFDTTTTLTKWDTLGSTHGVNTVNSALATSLPHSVESASNSVTASQVVDVGLYKAFTSLAGGSLPRQHSLSFDMYLDTIDSAHTALAVVGAIALRNAANALHELQFVVQMSNGGDAGNNVVATFPEYMEPGDGGATGFIPHGTTSNLTLRTWTRVTIEVSLVNPAGGSGNAARLYFNGTSVATIAINVTAQNPYPQLVLGLSYVSPPSDGWIVRYDNVTFNTLP